MKPRPQSAMTIPELLVSMGLYSLLMLVAWAFAYQSNALWRSISGSSDANLQLKVASRFLQGDLAETNFFQVATKVVPASLAAGHDGSALWMLSCFDSASGRSALRTDGSPFWQKNVLYYLVVPAGVSSTAEADANGFEVRCPYKVLVRKVIDFGTVTTPSSDPLTDEETLIDVNRIDAYLTRPVGIDVSAMRAEPGVREVQIVARNLLSFEAQIRPDADYLTEIQVVLRAVNIDAASKDGAIGPGSLKETSYTLAHLISVYPRN